MRKEDFKLHVDNFKLKEINKVSKGIETINADLIYKLDDLRDEIGLPIVITELNLGTHVENSYHTRFPDCRAVDFKVIGKISKQKVVEAMLDVGFKGIGVYRSEFHADLRPTPFYHADIRPRYKFWTRKNGKYLNLF